METIHIAMAICDASGHYSKFPATTMASLFEHTEAPIQIHILHDGTISEENQERFLQLAHHYGQGLQFHRVSLDGRLQDLPSLQSITVGTLFRTMIPDVLGDLSKVIYLDGDLIVNLDIQDLWQIDVSDYCLAGVLDVEDTREVVIKRHVYQQLGIDSKSYINAGVLLMNLDRMRQQSNLYQQALELLMAHPDLIYADQDVINKVYQSSLLLLPEIYNRQINLLDYPVDDPVSLPDASIVHFSGILKPWNGVHAQMAQDYFSYMAKTPWMQSLEDCIRIMSRIAPDYQKKMNLQRLLRNIPKGSGLAISVLCLAKGLLSDGAFKALWQGARRMVNR